MGCYVPAPHASKQRIVSPSTLLSVIAHQNTACLWQVGVKKEGSQPKKSATESLAAIEERDLEGYGTDTPPLQPGSPATHSPTRPPRVEPPASVFASAHEPKGSVLVDGLPLAEALVPPTAEPPAAEPPMTLQVFGRASIAAQRNLR